MPLSTFLNGGTATQLRGLQWLALSDVGHVLAGTVVSDSGGGGTFTWSAAGTFDCRIDPISAGSGGVTGGRIDERSTHLVTTTAGAAVTTNNRFAITSRGTFEVTATRTRTGALTEVFEVVEAS